MCGKWCGCYTLVEYRLHEIRGNPRDKPSRRRHLTVAYERIVTVAERTVGTNSESKLSAHTFPRTAQPLCAAAANTLLITRLHNLLVTEH